MQAPIRNNSKPSSSHHLLDQVVYQVNTVILGKTHPVKLALSCLLARGHLLIEDVPGVGKTTMAHVLAKVLGLQFNRKGLESMLIQW